MVGVGLEGGEGGRGGQGGCECLRFEVFVKIQIKKFGVVQEEGVGLGGSGWTLYVFKKRKRKKTTTKKQFDRAAIKTHDLRV